MYARVLYDAVMDQVHEEYAGIVRSLVGIYGLTLEDSEL